MGKREISLIKPDSIPGKQRPAPKINWNNKTIESYKENGFWDAEFPPHVNMQEREFLQVVDERQGSIKRVVTTMVRLKAIDYTTKNLERKEYLYWMENWYGNNWLGVAIPPVTDHIEGMFYEQLATLKLDPKTGDSSHYERKGQRESYYIPFTKKEVDKVIDENNGNRQLINFTVKFDAADSPDGQRRFATRGQFGYDQFVNWTFDDLYKLHIKPWKELDTNVGPTIRMYK
jgi:hypothetical protein